jgi:maltooligosyltrehalose synthase
VTESIDAAERSNPSMDSSAFAFLRSLLLGEPVDDSRLAARRAAIVKRLQQYTSGVQGQGSRGHCVYRDNTLLALNEVGGNPANPSMTDERLSPLQRAPGPVVARFDDRHVHARHEIGRRRTRPHRGR